MFQWRTRWRDYVGPPDAADEEREAMFLRAHWEYGALVHRVTAQALISALADEQAAKRRHALFLKLFAEAVNALESLGAWGWALRYRFEFRLFLDGFLSYPTGAPSEFYRAVLDDADALLVSLLNLPSRDRIIRATRELNPAEMTAREVAEALDLRVGRLRQSAEQWFERDRVLLSNYNKAKHGVTMLRLPAHAHTEADFQVLAPQLDLEEIEAGRWYSVTRFEVTDDMIARTMNHIEHTTGSIQHLSIIAWALDDAGLLYEPIG
jgi:hypothetical protein